MDKEEKVFLFDLDDTLLWNEYTYSLAAIEFFEFLIKIFNNRLPFIGGIAKRVEEISHQLVSEFNPETGEAFGFSMNRFPETLVRSYKELCENGWGKIDPSIAHSIYDIGNKAFDKELYKKAGMVPGAKRTLLFLLAQENVRLRLLTKGDPEVQRRKIDALELGSFFHSIEIVPNKDVALFFFWKERLSKDAKIFSVGNSFSSDIKPALEAGISAIFIPCYTWKAESVDISDLPTQQKINLQQIKEIREIVGIYYKL